MNTKEAYQEKFDAQLRGWSAKIDELMAKADKAKAEAKIEYCEQVTDYGPNRRQHKLNWRN